MKMQDLTVEIDQMLHALRLKNRKNILGRNTAVQYVVEDFGVILCGIDVSDYQMINENMERKFEGWRYIYITTDDIMIEKKYKVIWELMRAGYMKWIRLNFQREFTNLITMQDFGNKIIEERLRLWGNQPKYKFMIEDNTSAKNYPANMILAKEPAFFDYMP